MAKPIEALRKRRGMTQEDVAEKLRLPLIELRKFERGFEPPPPAVVRDLAVLFDCKVTGILGSEIPVEEWKNSPYAISPSDDDEYGNLKISVGAKEFEFPICQKAFKSARHQLSENSWDRDSTRDFWLNCWTLDNRLLMVNLKHARQITLRSDDDEATLPYEHPEVYLAWDQTSDDEDRQLGPVLKAALAQAVERHSHDTLEAQTRHIRVIYPDGTQDERDYHLYEDEVALEAFALKGNSFSIAPNTFLLVDQTPWHVYDWMNLSHVAIVDYPLERYHRLNAPE